TVTINTYVANTGTLNTATLNTYVANTGTLNTVTLNTYVANTGTLNTYVANTGTLNTAVINTVTINSVAYPTSAPTAAGQALVSSSTSAAIWQGIDPAVYSTSSGTVTSITVPVSLNT